VSAFWLRITAAAVNVTVGAIFFEQNWRGLPSQHRNHRVVMMAATSSVMSSNAPARWKAGCERRLGNRDLPVGPGNSVRLLCSTWSDDGGA
jgi:hypothetical protein